MNYNDILNNIADRMGQTTATPDDIPPIVRTPVDTTNDLLNKIGLEVQRQGGRQ